jgi:hypothetical protein
MSLSNRWSGVARIPILLGFLVAGCGDGAKEGPKGTPIAELVAGGKAPVEIAGIARSIGPVPSFRCRIRNLSDRAIDAVGWTAVFRDRDGKVVGSPADGGYADGLSPIAPGSEIQGMFGAPDDAATSAVLVLKQVVYRTPNPLGEKFGTLAAKWTNPKHAADVAAASKP